MRPLWVSHRGYKANAVENTLEAFRAAVAVGFRALETDLRLSSDGHILLHHDPHLGRLAGRADFVAQMTRAQLEKVSVGGGSRLLFLDEFVAEFAGCSWIFDIKPESGVEVVRALDAFARARGMHDWLIVNTKFVFWRREQERLLHGLMPGSTRYAREQECWRAGLSLITGTPSLGGIQPGRIYALPPRLGKVEFYRPAFIDAFRARGAGVIAFLPGSDDDARRAVRSGVDEVLTNGLIVGEEH